MSTDKPLPAWIQAKIIKSTEIHSQIMTADDHEKAQIKYLSYSYGATDLARAVLERSDKLVSTLEDLRHLNNHSINEELWRIDVALKAWREGDEK